MTRKEARQKAEQEFGEQSFIQRRGYIYEVGTTVLGYKEVFGSGKSFEEAFSKAEERKQFLASMEEQT